MSRLVVDAVDQEGVVQREQKAGVSRVHTVEHARLVVRLAVDAQGAALPGDGAVQERVPTTAHARTHYFAVRTDRGTRRQRGVSCACASTSARSSICAGCEGQGTTPSGVYAHVHIEVHALRDAHRVMAGKAARGKLCTHAFVQMSYRVAAC